VFIRVLLSKFPVASLLFVFLFFGLAACTRSLPGGYEPAPTGTLQPVQGGAGSLPAVTGEGATATPSFRLQPTRIPGSPILTPTPDAFHFSPSAASGPETYAVQSGDTLTTIAYRYGMSVDVLMAANGLTDPNVLSAGQVLTIPHPTPQAAGSNFKIIPDSELVYGPMSAAFDVDAFVRMKGGYLSGYAQEIDGERLTGAQVVVRVAQNYSVNPRLLLALLDYRSGWVTNHDPAPETLTEPLDVADGWHEGLYLQLTWAADALNRGYYLWRVDGITSWNLADGSAAPADPSINAGTAGVQSFFAQQDDYSAWLRDVSVNGLFAAYYALFGYPFDLAIEPILPADLLQPPMQLPFESGAPWAFTGGPHGGWDDGSAWAALDFAPAGTEGCVQSEAWVTAVADGLIVRAGNGAVVQDLDGDGYEQTGWTVLYMHVESRDRVGVGRYVRAGERIGHPSCEGGFAPATHLHLARRLNGEWISADGLVPFNLEGWISSGTGVGYDGYLTRGGQTVEAYNGTEAFNQIQR
jgi:LasA protease